MEFPRNAFIIKAQEIGKSAEFLDAALTYADALSLKGFPVIFSLVHFSIMSGCELIDLKKSIHRPEKFYKSYNIKKKRGGVRQINASLGVLKKAQRFLATYVLPHCQVSNSAYAFVKNRSIYDNAAMHVGQPYIRTFDIVDFFGSISRNRVIDLYKEIGYIENLAVDFGKLCTANLRGSGSAYLVQGSPASPMISNLIMRSFDKRMNSYAEANDIKYSRYADDITFSGERDNLPKPSFIERVLRSEGFLPNHKKTRTYGPKATRRLVTGLLVTVDGVKVQPAFKNEIHQHLYYIRKFGPKSHIEYLNTKRGYPKNYYYKWLRGKLLFLKMIEPEIAQPLLDELDEFDWGI